MAVLKDLIVHGPSNFLNTARFNAIKSDTVEAKRGIFNRLIAEDSTLTNATVVGLLDVAGELHTNSWSNSNIATIDGNFYIVPTVTADTATGSITYSGGAWSISVTGAFATNQLNLGNNTAVAWTSGSALVMTGEVLIGTDWMPLGTLKGTLGGSNLAINASSKAIEVIGLKDGHSNDPATLQTIYAMTTSLSGLQFRKVKVSIYARKSDSKNYPLGILLTAQGTSAKQTFIDIYGGNNEENKQTGTINGVTASYTLPTVRIGNLNGLPKVGEVTPAGWGIYTNNGFFSGTIAATSGKIGKYTITGSYLYTGTGASQAGIGGDQAFWAGSNTSNSAPFRVSYTGVLNATGATISGALTATSLSTGTKTASTTGNGFYVDGSGNIYVGNGSTNNFTVTAAGAMTAKSGTIGGFSIDSNSLHNGTFGTANSVLVSTGTSANASIGGSGSINGWAFTAGTGFGVTKAGVLYATGANISGKITIDSGSNVYTKDETTSVANTVVNNLDIGGNNLLLQNPCAVNSAAYQVYVFALSEPLIAGQTYTLQFWDVAISNTPTTANSIAVYLGGGIHSLVANKAPTSGYWTATFTPTAAQLATDDGKNRTIYIYNTTPSGAATARSLKIGKWKLEKGNKATAWSICPADTKAGKNLLRGTAEMNVGSGGYAQGHFRASGGTVTHVSVSNPPIPGITGAVRVTNGTSAVARIGFAQDTISGKFVTGRQYTLSCWIRASVAKLPETLQPIWISSSQTTGGTNSTVTMQSWHYISTTLTLAGDQATTYSAGYVYVNNVPVNGWFEVCGLKLEEGNMATGWTPAPEDQEAYTDAAKASAINTAASDATTKANNAAKTATNYITNIDSNKGITVKPQDSSGNDYLQMNSTDIRFVRNNTDVMNLTDSAFRIGTAAGKHTTVDTNGLHVWTGAESTASNEVALFGTTARIGTASGKHTTTDTNGFHVWTGAESTASNEVAVLDGTTLRVGAPTKQRVDINTGGLQLYSSANSVIANLGYASGKNISGGTSVTPYFTYGTRATNSVIGNYSISEGISNTASGAHSHASGYYVTASGGCSFAHGYYTIASGDYQFVAGRYNVEDSSGDNLFIIGNGENASTRRNAFSVSKSGYVQTYKDELLDNTNSTRKFVNSGSNATITSAKYIRRGNIAQIYISWTVNAALSVPASGNISNIEVGILLEDYRPVILTAAFSNGDNAGAAWYNIDTNGVIKLGACEGTGSARTIAKNTAFNLYATYIVE